MKKKAALKKERWRKYKDFRENEKRKIWKSKDAKWNLKKEWRNR